MHTYTGSRLSRDHFAGPSTIAAVVHAKTPYTATSVGMRVAALHVPHQRNQIDFLVGLPDWPVLSTIAIRLLIPITVTHYRTRALESGAAYSCSERSPCALALLATS